MATRKSQERARDKWILDNADYNFYIKSRSESRRFANRKPGGKLDNILKEGDSRIDYIKDLEETAEFYREAIAREKGKK